MRALHPAVIGAMGLVLTLVVTLVLAAVLIAPAAAQQAGTCVSPGPCPAAAPAFQHVKVIECPRGLWPDDFWFSGQVPLNVVPLAGELGLSQAAQCDLLRDALTGARR